MSSTPEPEPMPVPHDGLAAAQTLSEAEQAPSATGEQTPSATGQTPSEAAQTSSEAGQTPPATEHTPASSPTVRPAAPRPAAKLIFDDPLNQQSSDDTDRGWGERPAGGDSAADLARFLDEKPPHHL